MSLGIKTKEQCVRVMKMLGIPTYIDIPSDDQFPIGWIQFGPLLKISFDEMAEVVDYLRGCEKEAPTFSDEQREAWRKMQRDMLEEENQGEKEQKGLSNAQAKCLKSLISDKEDNAKIIQTF